MADHDGKRPQIGLQDPQHKRLDRLAELVVFLAVTTLAFAISILIVLTDHVIEPGTATTGATCTLQVNSINVCHYGFAVCIVSFLLSVIAFFALCRPPVAIAAVSLFAAVWWFGWSVTVSVYNKAASDRGYPQGHFRATVVGLSWATFVCQLLAFGLAAHLYRVGYVPIEVGGREVGDFDSYAQFKARQTEEAKAKAGGGKGALARLSAGVARVSASVPPV